MFCCSSTICHSTHSLCVTVTLSLIYNCSSINLLVAPMLFSCATTNQSSSFCVTLFRSFSLSLSLHHGHSLCLFFSTILSHTIPLLFSTQGVRSFTGCPFSDVFDGDNQIAKFDIIACGIWNTKSSHVHFQSISWHCVHVSLLWYSSHSVLFFFINCFIASLFLLMPLPQSLPMYLSQTTTISLYLSLSLAQSPFYSPYRYYFVIVSRYLPLSFTFSLFGTTSDYSSLYLCDIIPLLLSFLLWYDYHYYCFVFVLITIICLLVLLLANMEINILEKSILFFSHDFLYFFIFSFFLFSYLLYIHISDKFLFFCFSVFLSSSIFIFF